MSARRPPVDATLEQALALGGTRVATVAHPLCMCRPVADCHDPLHLGPERLVMVAAAVCPHCRYGCLMHGGAA